MTAQTPRWLARRVGVSLEQAGEPELERVLVAGALVEREGDHYRIVRGGESPEDLVELERSHTAQPTAAEASCTALAAGTRSAPEADPAERR